MVRDRSLDVAVVGLAGRFPGSDDILEWWDAVKAGRVLTTRYDRSALLDAGVSGEVLDDPDYVPVRAHLQNADCFDNTLFRVSPRDAELMDPQHRLMLEVAWSALEDAGTGLGDVVVRTGVYASQSGSDYMRSIVASRELDSETVEQVIHGNEPDFVASLISYKLALTGPAIAVQTACSSSLVALHLAVQGLLNGDCDQAIVVGAGIAYPQAGHLHIPGGIHSASGHCRPFDEKADGVVAGSGVVCVVLRRLHDALEDQLESYGVILGSAVNNDGAARAGYYAPSGEGQERAIRHALAVAGVDAASIGYLEAHATGTRIGDPIEWAAASAAFRGAGAQPGQIAVGALKANIGHLDAASGVASLVKTMLVLKEGTIPPIAGLRTLNPLLASDDSPLFSPVEAMEWTGPLPRRAGVSSFGIGGTNAHVIVEQPPLQSTPSTGPAEDASASLVVLSAAEPEALARSAARTAEHLVRAMPALDDVSFTLSRGRAALPERLAVTGRTAAEVAERLESESDFARGRADGTASAVMMFPGQGSHRSGMADPLAKTLPGFTDALEDCLAWFDTALAERVQACLLDHQFPAAELDATELAQPAIFAAEYAAGSALVSLGIAPVAMAGHSLGEITAACLAGGLSLSHAARLVVARGSAMQNCPAGSMLALGCDERSARELIVSAGLDVELAAINAEELCVVAGKREAIEAFREQVGSDVFTKILRANRAFHSTHIEPALPALAHVLDGLVFERLTVPIVSSIDGQLIPVEEKLQPEMFVRQARRPVRFASCVESVAIHFPNATVIELGPGRELSTMVESTTDLHAVALTSGHYGADDEQVLAALGELWALGHEIDIQAVSSEGRPVHLPGYQFAGRRFIAPEASVLRNRAAAFSGGHLSSPCQVVMDKGALSFDDPSTSDPAALLAELWHEILGQAEIADDSDFFDLGGDSLSFTKLARKLRQELGVQIPLRPMLAARTLGGQITVVQRYLEEHTATP